MPTNDDVTKMSDEELTREVTDACVRDDALADDRTDVTSHAKELSRRLAELRKFQTLSAMSLGIPCDHDKPKAILDRLELVLAIRQEATKANVRLSNGLVAARAEIDRMKAQ